VGENIELNTQYAQDLWRVRADSNQLEQVVLNLAVNARDAMPSGGRLTIATSNVDIDDEYSSTHASHRAGPYVLLTVTDNGHGMTREVQSHIFEPFFTTKERGQGTGLGLATVYGIVKQSGGFIYVYSEPGQGTTFKVYLPRVEGEVAKTSASPVTVTTGTETILLVEDQSDLRGVIVNMLQSAGYRVLEASTAAQARTMAEQASQPIHALITDLVLSDSDGRKVAQQVRDLHAGIRVLYISGYADDVLRRGEPESNVHFLQKPFSLRALLTTVRRLLDGATP
jgi:CheY-like chemotaxis protein